MTFNFVPPGNPLSYWDRPFRNRRTQRTNYGLVCYFCRVVVDKDCSDGRTAPHRGGSRPRPVRPRPRPPVGRPGALRADGPRAVVPPAWGRLLPDHRRHPRGDRQGHLPALPGEARVPRLRDGRPPPRGHLGRPHGSGSATTGGHGRSGRRARERRVAARLHPVRPPWPREAPGVRPLLRGVRLVAHDAGGRHRPPRRRCRRMGDAGQQHGWRWALGAVEPPTAQRGRG
jgi:hypothetical protein